MIQRHVKIVVRIEKLKVAVTLLLVRSPGWRNGPILRTAPLTRCQPCRYLAPGSAHAQDLIAARRFNHPLSLRGRPVLSLSFPFLPFSPLQPLLLSSTERRHQVKGKISRYN